MLRAALLAGFMALPLQAQEAEDGVIGACLAQNNSSALCICASLMLHSRFGDEQYARFGAISERIAQINAGAAAEEGELAGLTREGYRFFVPHGQALSVCRDKIGAAE
ncbi:MAG: hypothetical protein COB08_013630 [Rhodobacteraceae bacterium]|nr:hypothetical protein [Paracoccaceae bacterium]